MQGEVAQDRTRPFPQADRHARAVMDELAAALWYLEGLNEQLEIAEHVSTIEQKTPPGVVRQCLNEAFISHGERIAAESRRTQDTIERLERTLSIAYWDVSAPVKLEIEVFIEMRPEPTDARAREAMEEILRERAKGTATGEQPSD